MNVAIFGGFGKRMLATGWTKETAVAILGGGDFDLVGIEPGENARLTVVAILGGIDIVVDEGTQVTMSGFSLFGGRNVSVAAGEGPRVGVRAFSLFGGVEVRPPKLH
jgi:hypothetical protein